MPYFAALGDELAENNVSEPELATANEIKRLVDAASMDQVVANLADVQSLWFRVSFEAHRARTKGCALYALREAYEYNNALQRNPHVAVNQKQVMDELVNKMSEVIKSGAKEKLKEAPKLFDLIEGWLDDCSSNEDERKLCKAFFVYSKALSLKLQSLQGWTVEGVAFNQVVSSDIKQGLSERLSRICSKAKAIIEQPISTDSLELDDVPLILDDDQSDASSLSEPSLSADLAVSNDEAQALLDSTVQNENALSLDASNFLDKLESFEQLLVLKSQQTFSNSPSSIISSKTRHHGERGESKTRVELASDITSVCKTIANNDNVLLRHLMHASTKEIRKVSDQLSVSVKLNNDQQFLDSFITNNRKSMSLKQRYFLSKMGIPHTLSADERTMIELRKEAKILRATCATLLNTNMQSAILANQFSQRGRIFPLGEFEHNMEQFKEKLDGLQVDNRSNLRPGSGS